MAQSSSHVLPTVLRAGSPATRSNSIVSTTSSNSGASLSRRSRTRPRALTSTRRGKSLGPARHSAEDSQLSSANEDALPLPPLLISDREDDAVSSSGESLVFSPPPTRRFRPSGLDSRPLHLTDRPPEAVFQGRERARSSANARDVFVDPTISRGRQARSEGGSIRGVKTSVRGSSLPRHAFRNIGSSPTSSQPSPLTPSNLISNAMAARVHEHERRDSLISYGSSTSSSLYPQSTASHPESSLGPHSLRDQDEDASSFSPRIVTFSEKDADFDVDDVSYRLRLLVNNSYFLPPAHSKPSPLSLAPTLQPAQKGAKPPSSPGLLGFFGLGKTKSKPASPAAQSPPLLDLPPVLRTTSDSTTASGYAPRPQVRPLPQSPMHPPFAGAHASASPNRVVVLREKMDDLMTAAKQAEKDIKIKAEVRKATNYSASPDLGYADDVIDPTDAVDLPAPTDNYPFTVQTSAIHGLGIGESVGANELAERLPPSPGLWSMTSEEDIWRRALLREAVSHSLVNSLDNSFSSSTASPHHPSPSSANSSSFRSSFPEHDAPSEEHATDCTPKARIGQRIMAPEQIEGELEAADPSPIASVFPSPSSKSMNGGGFSPSSEAPPHSPWGQCIPVGALNRAETPALAQALAPPPRRIPAQSQSHTDLPTTLAINSLASDRLLRRVVSSPRLSAVPGTEMFPMRMTPPLANNLQQRISPASSATQLRHAESVPTFSSSRQTMCSTSTSHYSDDSLSYATPTGDMDDDEAESRPSLSISIHTDGQASLYSHPSPTASAFQDAVFGSCRTPSPLTRMSHPNLPEQAGTSQVADLPARSTVVSPPPRTSSSLGPTILPPPPRSPAMKPVYRPSMSSTTSHKSGRSSHSSTPLPSDSLREEAEEHEPSIPLESPSSPILSREPMTYPQPLAERRGHPPTLSLRIPTESVTPAIHSAPAPASPTAFFDRIQSHPNAMDDLETSDESEDEDTAGGKSGGSPPSADGPAPFVGETRTRALSGGAATPGGPKSYIMRLGNHSTPHLSPSAYEEMPPFVMQDRKPVGNTPALPQNTFFASRKKAGGDFPLGLSDAQGSKVSLALTPGQSAINDGTGPLRVTTAGPSRSRSSSKRRPATANTTGRKPRVFQRESLQKFDGMLLQHMAAEKDTIKRITTNISGSRS